MIYITFFGDFSLSQNGVTLSARTSGATRLFRALAYLIKHRQRAIDLAEFSRFLHNDKNFSRYQSDSLVKTTLHRLRELLSVFGDETLLVQNGAVTFSEALAFSSDTERFEAIISAYREADNSEKPTLFEELITLYPARYLASFSGDSVTMPEAERYHRAFTALANDALEQLVALSEYRKAYTIAQKLIPIDPFAESFHYYRIYALLLSGDRALAETLYRSASLSFRREFHVTPSARFHALGELFKTDAPFDADTLDEALTKLSDTLKAEKQAETLADPVDLLRAASLLDTGYLVYLGGDVEKLLPDLPAIFGKKTLVSRLGKHSVLLLSTLDSDSFTKAYRTLDATVKALSLAVKTEYRTLREIPVG